MVNKRGSVMVEAAIIYPLAIGAVMAVIYIMICMYTGAAIKSNLNVLLRYNLLEKTQAGEIINLEERFVPDDKYGKSAFNKKICITEGSDSGVKVLLGTTPHSYKGNGLMRNIIRRNHQGAIYLIDEKDYIRKVDMVIK
ncbi:hypothetical protein [Aminipila sp.]|jgi:hypothetical protein|uniref:hypothetical protein n=1 Tax=Aminipila sp. TaxID=2060095 RepID=UPI002898056A|nr:hypothetical protein [Aminipila sp.]